MQNLDVIPTLYIDLNTPSMMSVFLIQFDIFWRSMKSGW